LLGAKYPRLIPFVITFKVLDQGDSKDKDGAGVGVFVISRREDVGYIPVVMSNGSIVSCEMVYDKDKDTLFPLIPKMIKRIVGENMTQEHTLVRAPSVENTKDLYQNMFRPPASSRPVLAGATDLVESLPDDAKKALRTYFNDNPQVLAKVAQFYPVEKLAAKLADGGTEATKQAAEQEIEDYRYLDKVVRLEDLTKEAAEKLPDELKAEVLEAGFAITEIPESPPRVYTEDALPGIAEEVFKASEVTLIPKDNRHHWDEVACASGGTNNDKKVFGTGCLLRYDGSEFIKEPCLVAGGSIITNDGCYRSPDSLVLTNFKEGIQEEDLAGFNLISPEDIKTQNEVRATVLYPVKRGGYKAKDISVYAPKKITGDDGFLGIAGEYSDVGFSLNVDYGVHTLENGRHPSNWVFPVSSMVYQHDQYPRELPSFYIRTIAALTPLLMRASVNLQLVKDAGDHTLINRTADTTVKFASAPELVNHLVTTYNFDKTAADTLLDKKKVYFAKEAYQLPMGSSEHASNSMWAAPQQQSQGQPETRIIDGSMIEDLAEFEDPEMLDTGMIGSLAHADDIKSLLLDSVQSFEDTVTDIGKSMLLFAINKQEMEDHYGREDYSSVMHNLNTGFSTLGGLVFDIKEYTNNATYSMDNDE